MRFAILATVTLLSACGHTSQYSPPADGRPRAVWKDDHVAMAAAGAPLSTGCLQEIFALTDSDALRLDSGDYTRPLPPDRGGAAPFIIAAAIWTPRFYGPRIVVPHPGIAPIFLAPPLFLPRPSLVVPPPRPLGVAGGVPSGSGPRIGDSDGRVWVILAAVAIIVMPAVALGLALSRPEDSDRNADAIDQVNAYNDLLRSPGSPCTWSGS